MYNDFGLIETAVNLIKFESYLYFLRLIIDLLHGNGFVIDFQEIAKLLLLLLLLLLFNLRISILD